MTVHSKLLEVLVCPACKGPLSPVQAPAQPQEQLQDQQQDQAQAQPEPAPAAASSPAGLDCPACRLRYPIVDDIPVMLVDQAVRLRA